MPGFTGQPPVASRMCLALLRVPSASSTVVRPDAAARGVSNVSTPLPASKLAIDPFQAVQLALSLAGRPASRKRRRS